MEGVVVVDGQNNRVEEDTEENGILEPSPGNQPDQTFPEFALFIDTAEGLLGKLRSVEVLPDRSAYDT